MYAHYTFLLRSLLEEIEDWVIFCWPLLSGMYILIDGTPYSVTLAIYLILASQSGTSLARSA